MTTVSKIIIGVLLGALITIVLLWQIQGCGYRKTITDTNKQLYACTHAPVKVHDSIIHDTILDPHWYKPKVVHDTAYIDTVKPKWCTGDFADSYKVVRGILAGGFKYAIHVKDCVPEIQFSEINFPIDYRIETKTVLHDTSIYSPRNHWGVTVGLGINNTRTFPAVQAGVFWTLKDKLMLEPSLMYLDGHLYGQAVLGVFLDKH